MTTDLATRNGQTGMMDWAVLKEQAAMLVKTNFLPDAIKTPEQAIAIMLKGKELGLPPMYALSNISIVKGKPTTGAEAIAALIFRDHGDSALDVVESTAKRCIVRYKRKTATEFRTFEFTIEEAQTAGLLANPVWKQYPKTMLRWRAISAVGKLAFPDTVGGLYTPEELGVDVTVGEMEETVIAQGAPEDTIADEIVQEPAQTQPAPSRQPTISRAELEKRWNNLFQACQARGIDVEDLQGELSDLDLADSIRQMSHKLNQATSGK